MTGPEDAVVELCADEPKRSSKTKQNQLKRKFSSDIAAPRPSDPVRHSAHCLARPVVYGTRLERDLRSVASESEELLASVRDSRMGTSIFANERS